MDALTNRCIFVIGTGRSGTSATSNVLHHLGVFMGTFNPPSRTNRYGNYEDKEFWALNRVITGGDVQKGLEEFRRIVDSRKDYPIWGLKDSATSYTLPILAPLLTDLRIIVVSRPAEECIASYRKGYGASARNADAWYYSLKNALDANTRLFKGPIMEVQFHDLLADTESVVDKMVEFVFEGMDKPSDDVIEAAYKVVVKGVKPIECKICGRKAEYAYSKSSPRKEYATQFDFYICTFCGFAFTHALDRINLSEFYGPGYERFDNAAGKRGLREVNVALRATNVYGNHGKHVASFGDRIGSGAENLRQDGFTALSADFGASGPGRWDLQNGMPDDTFDVITLIEVAEHFIDPLQEFLRISQLLNPGGVLCGTTGCRDFAEICRDSKPESRWWYCDRTRCGGGHISLYSLSSLMYIARECNMELFVEPRNPAVTDYMGQSQVIFYLRRMI